MATEILIVGPSTCRPLFNQKSIKAVAFGTKEVSKMSFLLKQASPAEKKEEESGEPDAKKAKTSSDAGKIMSKTGPF